MSPLSVRRRLARLRGSLAAVACVLALGGAIVAHHTEPPGGHHGMGLHGVATMAMCLGVLGLAAVAIAALPSWRPVAPLRAPRALGAGGLVPVTAGAHPTRAGPPLFLTFSVLRL